MSFADFVAEARGISTRHIRRIIQAGRGLSAEEALALEKAPRRITLDDLSELSTISEAEERDYVLKSLVTGEAKKAAAARRNWQAQRGEQPTPTNPADQEYKRLADAWQRARKTARLRFLNECIAEIRADLADLDVEDDDA